MTRLPIPGSDQGNWGQILNDFLSVSLNDSGTLKPIDKNKVVGLSTDLSSLAQKNNPVFTGNVTLPGDPTSNLHAATKQYVDSTTTAGAPDASTTVKGIVKLSGDLTGSANAPSIATGSINNSKVSATAAIEKSKLAPLNILDSDVAVGAGISQSKINNLTTDLSSKQNNSSDLSAIASLSPTDNDVIQRKSGNWTNRSPSQLKTDLSISKTDVGLDNVDNTSDANKPVSTATQSALNSKAEDSAVVHNAGPETIAGVKTFSSSPLVPDPTVDAEAASKSYVDSVAGGPDATTSSKGIIQLSGDLAGTATSPVVAPGAINNSKISNSAAIDESKLALTSDASAGTASIRSLGSGAQQAAPGNDSRFPSDPTSEPDNRWLVTSSGAIGYTNAPYTPAGTDVAIADGGTGASNASGARTNLGAVGTTGGGIEAYQDHGNVGSSEDIDLSNGNVHRIVLDNASCVLTLSSATNSTACSLTVIVVQDSTGGRSITWPSSVKWPEGIVANIGTLANSVSVITLITVDGGTTWLGMMSGASFA